MSDHTPSSLKELTPADAALFEAEAKLKRAQARTTSASTEAAKLLAEADSLEAYAGRIRSPDTGGLLELRIGHGSEVSLLPSDKMALNMRDVAEAVHAPPDMLAAQASLDRLSLVREAGALSLAVEAADSVGADNAVEQMLVHGMSTAHRLSMRLMAAAETELRYHENYRLLEGTRTDLAGANRSALTAARLLDSLSRAAATLDRLRNGGRQQVTVQYVTVGEGGQAVVAGKMETGAGRATLAGKRGGGPE